MEIDINNDSLGCGRRLLADIVTFNHKGGRKINNGLMVLSNFPKEGSHDVYFQIERINKFPKTNHLNIYVTTVAFLRYCVKNKDLSEIPYSDLFFNIAKEKKEQYLERLISNRIITDEIASELFL